MPSQSEILERAINLPQHSWEGKIDIGKVWSGSKSGTRFEFTKLEPLEVDGEIISCLVLVFKGKEAGRKQLIKSFTQALGKSLITSKDALRMGIPMISREEALIWDTNKALSHIRKQLL